MAHRFVNRRGFLGWAGVVGLGVLAHHRPGHHHGPPATTTTTTGVPLPTTTTTRTGAPSGPLTINAAGTYSGTYESTSVGTPAITINTTGAVVLDRVHVRHKGRGIDSGVSGVNLTVTNSTLVRTAPGTTTAGADGRAINLLSASSLIVEHCELVRGNGVYVQGAGTLSGRVRYNYCEDIGYHGLSDCCVQFFQSNGHSMPNFEIAWNHTVNRHNQTGIEDNINLFDTSGTSGNVVDIHHNLIDGAYETNSNGDGYTGGGILVGDEGGSFITVRDNYVVGTSNYGVSIAGGSNNTLLRNTVVSDSLTQDGVLHSPTFGTGVTAWDAASAGGMTGITVQDNVSGWLRRTGVGSNTERSDFWLPEADVDSGNTSLGGSVDAADEQDARDDWDTARVAASVIVGPLPLIS